MKRIEYKIGTSRGVYHGIGSRLVLGVISPREIRTDRVALDIAGMPCRASYIPVDLHSKWQFLSQESFLTKLLLNCLWANG